MQYTVERYHLRVQFETKQCTVPPDEMTRMQRHLEPLGEALGDFAASDLRLTVVHHPDSGTYHVEGRLKLPGRTLTAAERDAYLDSAFQRCVRGLERELQAYKVRPDRDADEVAERLAALDRDVVTPSEPDAGPLGEAVQAGDYAAFRRVLYGYEDWLRNRIGRWVQRYPAADARIGRGLALGDLVEEIFLNAFEEYGRRPTAVSFSDWLDGLIDPSLKEFLRHPDEEQENASLARTWRDTPLG